MVVKISGTAEAGPAIGVDFDPTEAADFHVPYLGAPAVHRAVEVEGLIGEMQAAAQFAPNFNQPISAARITQ